MSEDNDSDEEPQVKFVKTKRLLLLNKEELLGLERSTSAPAGLLEFPSVFCPKLPMNIEAPVFVPVAGELQQFKGEILTMCKDQQGSRFLQQKYCGSSPVDKQLLFSETAGNVHELVTDVFGNYVIQKIIEFGPAEYRTEILRKLLGRTVEFSLHMYGCRVMQKAFEFGDFEQKVLLAQELKESVNTCIKDQNGNHVIQKVVEKLPPQYFEFVVQCLSADPVGWALHPYGCRVIQKILEKAPKERVVGVVQALISEALVLSREPYGNYVVQYILEKGNPNDRFSMVNGFCGRLTELTRHKYSSNVVEKCLVAGTPEQVNSYAEELFNSTDILDLMTDKFANFVIQKVIEVSHRQKRQEMVQFVDLNASALRNSPQGRYVLNFIEKLKRGS